MIGHSLARDGPTRWQVDLCSTACVLAASGWAAWYRSIEKACVLLASEKRHKLPARWLRLASMKPPLYPLLATLASLLLYQTLKSPPQKKKKKKKMIDAPKYCTQAPAWSFGDLWPIWHCFPSVVGKHSIETLDVNLSWWRVSSPA